MIYIFILFIFIWYCIRVYLKFEKQCRYPKNFHHSKFIKNYKSSHNIRDGFSKKKIPENIDTIIIGSGISALTCGGLLSRSGQRVLILEQHYIAGGSTHSFEDKGFEFDTGVHYIGNISKRKQILDLITEPKIEWDQMGTKDNGWIYDEIVIGENHYYLKSGEKGFLSEIKKYWPEEENNIIEYLKYVKKVAKSDKYFNFKIIRSKCLRKILNNLMNEFFFKNTNEKAIDVISKFTKNKELQAFLCGQFGDYGKLPSEESFFIHASIVNHYLNGGWFPRGGSSVIAKNIIPIIEKTGGRVLVRKAVKNIIFKNNRAIGVKMSNGVEIFAKNIVSSVGIPNTWRKLVPKGLVPNHITEKINKLGLSSTFTYAFVGIDGTPDELELRSSNIWHWPSSNFKDMLEKYLKNPKLAPIPMFIGFPCAKDSTWNKRFPGKSNAVILTLSNYEEFDEWKNDRQGKRRIEYQNKKKIYAERILQEGLYKYYPKIKGRVKYCEVGTPLTFNYYIGSQKGECYGLNSGDLRYLKDDWLVPKSDIEGLFLTGQDIVSIGVTGAMMAGVLTAHSVLGYGTITDIISGRNLITDIMHIR